MAEENENDGLKEGEGTPENQPNSENQPSGSEPLKTPEESPEEVAARLLKDGTPADKEIKVNKKTYDDKSEKAKLYEAHAPLLDKVLKNPELVESLLETKQKGNLDERLERLEDERKEEKRQEISTATIEALRQWPELKDYWEQVQPITDSLVKQHGIPYREALRRGYFAVNPEAASVERERVAREGLNIRGTFPSSLGYSPKPASSKDNLRLSDPEKRVAKALGRSEEEYADLLEKHKDWLEVKGFNQAKD